MDKLKKYQISTVLGGALFIVGLILCSLRATDIMSHKIVDAKVLAVEEFNAECRRVSGKYGACINANVEVQFPINKEKELRTGKILVEHAGGRVSVGSNIKVMFMEGKPETVKLADFSSGWKGPLGVFFLGSLILIVSRSANFRPHSSHSEEQIQAKK